MIKRYAIAGFTHLSDWILRALEVPVQMVAMVLGFLIVILALRASVWVPEFLWTIHPLLGLFLGVPAAAVMLFAIGYGVLAFMYHDPSSHGAPPGSGTCFD